MEWESSQDYEPMDWEEISKVRYPKKSKVSETVGTKTTFTSQRTTPPTAPNEVMPASSAPKKVLEKGTTDLLRVFQAEDSYQTQSPTSGRAWKLYIRSEKRKDSPRGTTGSRPPSGVPWTTLRSCEGEQRLTGYF
ncbi:hypothetical protein NPIL_147711 [Nephila pilipes]|uniref:Uncharacterized protein n=1 Tax=Nephila pilipes TaxID=299642 RepID=A0A8X6I4I8_NEPPI|nr:hypothetical protein NPIL_147711 [Nephila pilipes]